ncbi:hypothetical protein QJQ45_004924 [Haematococcus lacustris]|nr:hypothetical protein QJQ45_004924 [Haematococcus lacustris]
MADFDLEGGLRDSKFSHLLRPIRDLADNWGIDIANDLEEYLAHLSSTAFAFEQTGPYLDFAEAALLIQSSACVYSKKVEYLHTLVYQALQAARTKKAGDGSNITAGAEGRPTQSRATASNAVDLDVDVLDSFLDISQALTVADDINLAEEDALNNTFTRPPAALLALEDQSNGAGDSDTGFFHLAQCHVHVSGALLLDAADGHLYDQQLRHNNTSTHSWAGILQAQQQQQLQHHAATADDSDDDAGPGDQGMSDDDDAPAPLATGAAGPATTAAGSGVASAAPVVSTGTVAMATSQVMTSGPALESQQAAVAPTQQLAKAPPVFDPYEPLDMHAKGSLLLRPLLVRKPCKSRMIPAIIAARKLNNSSGAASAGRSSSAAGGLINPEFAYALQLIAPLAPSAPARQVATDKCRAGRKKAEAVAMLDPAGLAAVVEQQQAQQQAAADEDDGAVDDGWAGQQDDDDIGPGGASAIPEHEGWRGALAGSDAWAGPDAAQEPSGGDVAASYEELCRSHIDAMLAAAAAQEVQTELAQRVGCWRSKIDPVLRMEEHRSTFDIQQYQSRILSKMCTSSADYEQAVGVVPSSLVLSAVKPKDVVVSFGTVAAQHDKFEVSRTFAAMLQLINNRNVHIVKQGGPDEPFRLQLLDKELPHGRMRERLGAAAGPGAKPAAALPADEQEPGSDVENDDMSQQQQQQLSQQAASGRQKAGKKGSKGKAQQGKRQRCQTTDFSPSASP